MEEEVKDNLEEEVQEEIKNEEKVIKKEKKKIKHLEKEVESFNEELKKKDEEILKLQDQILRKQADFENFRKRTMEDRQKDRKYALQDFLEEAIEMLDIFDLQVSKDVDDEKLMKYLNGFKMINMKLKNILENNGVKMIDCLNKPFDPSVASALETVENNEVDNNTVVEVVIRGYMYKDRVLRPAMVKVSKKNEEKDN